MTPKSIIEQIEKMFGRQSEAYMIQMMNDGLNEIASIKQDYTASSTTDLDKKKRWYGLDDNVIDIATDLPPDISFVSLIAEATLPGDVL